MSKTMSKVLEIVIENKSESGAQFPVDFKMTGLKDAKLWQILSWLADDGQAIHQENKKLLFKDTSTVP
jgi:hypothetical protein